MTTETQETTPRFTLPPDLDETTASDPSVTDTEERDERAGSWPFSGDAVTQATGKYPPETREAVRWFFEVCHPTMGMKQAAMLLLKDNDEAYDSTTLYRVCLGTYEGSLKNVTKAILRYRRDYEGSRRASGTADFYMTSIAKGIHRVLNSAMKYHRIALITGPTQIGKSEAAYEFQRQNNHGKTKLIRMAAGGGVQLLWKECATACRISRDQPCETLRERVLKAVDADHLLIFDEAEQIFATYQKQSRMKVIETIREIHDRTKCGVGIIAAPSFEDEMEEGNLAVMLAKFGARCVFRLHLDNASKLPKQDIAGLAATHGLRAPSEPDEQFVRDIMLAEGLTMYSVTLQAAEALAETKKRPISWDLFREAYNIIHKGRKPRSHK